MRSTYCILLWTTHIEEALACPGIAAVILTSTTQVHFFFQAECGIRGLTVTGVQTCALPILRAEVLERLDEALAEHQLPQAVDDHPRHQRVVAGHHPPRQIEPSRPPSLHAEGRQRRRH